MTELTDRLAEAGTTAERQPDGTVAVTNWPKPRVSNPHFLDDLAEEWLREQPPVGQS